MPVIFFILFISIYIPQAVPYRHILSLDEFAVHHCQIGLHVLHKLVGPLLISVGL